jgi:hypothetical protein
MNALSVFSKMTSTRPTRSKPVAPILNQTLERINALNGKYYENIRNEVATVTKYFKEDPDAISEFWLADYEYNMLDFKHQYLFKTILAETGLKQEKIVEFLNKIMDETILSKLGAIRVNNGKKIFYRIRVGLDTDD